MYYFRKSEKPLVSVFLCRLTECRAIGLYPLDKHIGMMSQVGPGLAG